MKFSQPLLEPFEHRFFWLKDVLVLAGLVIITSFFAAGFFFSDPLLTEEGSYGIHRRLAQALEIGGVLLVPCAAVLYACVRVKMVSAGTLALAALGIIAALLIAYPVFVEVYFSKTQATLKEEFHPFLQIKPLPITLRAGASPHPIRIVCIGGSTTRWPNTEGVQWSAMLEERLQRECPECDVQVYNQGMDWYTSLHALINYAANIRRIKPDVVIVMFGINDLMHNLDFGHLSNGLFRSDYGHYLGPVARLIQRPGPLGVIYEHFRRHWYAPERRTIVSEQYPGIESFRDNLMTLADLTEKDGARLVLMTEPYLYRGDLSDAERRRLVMYNFEAYGESFRWSFDSAERGMAKYAEATRAVARERNAALVDLANDLPKSLDYFVDDVHYTDRSYEIVAGEIAQTIGPAVEELARSKARPGQPGGLQVNELPALGETTALVGDGQGRASPVMLRSSAPNL